MKSLVLLALLDMSAVFVICVRFKFYPCIGSEGVLATYETGRSPAEENQYSVTMLMYFPEDITIPDVVNVTVEFDSEAKLELGAQGKTCTILTSNTTFHFIQCMKSGPQSDYLDFYVKGPPNGAVPHFKSVKVLGRENCEEPKVGYLNDYRLDYRTNCGRRQIEFTELIANGSPTKHGDWPWHAAVYERKSPQNTSTYICGGTLITKLVVLTAAHCVVRNGEALQPDVLTVIFGKYHLIEKDRTTQEKEVLSVIVHFSFGYPSRLEHDIAMLKMRTEVDYTDYVQPACLWFTDAYHRLPSRIEGSVVGWGYDESGTSTSELRHATVPERTYAECVMKHPTFYGNLLTKTWKFCAGWGNGTSPCNGDSGGGFMVFVPDDPADESALATGYWCLKGIVSLSVPQRNKNVCDPNYYVVFTEVSLYIQWILQHAHR